MVSNSEASANWEGFFEDMIGRGLRKPLLIACDGAKGVIRSISQCFPKAQLQRCIAHKIRNILTKVPMKVEKEIKGRIKSIYYVPDREIADALSERFISDYAEKYPAMIKCFTDDLSACLTHLEYPEGHRRSIRTTNLIERAFVEEKRRTKIITQHAHKKGAIGLFFASEQRYTIECLLAKGKLITYIAETISKDKSVVSREIKRNTNERTGVYSYKNAQKLYKTRQKWKHKRTYLTESIISTIKYYLELDYSPEQIVDFCRKNALPCVSHESIYQYIWKCKAKGQSLHLHLRRKGRRYQKRGSQYKSRGILTNRRDIDERPAIVEEKNDLVIWK